MNRITGIGGRLLLAWRPDGWALLDLDSNRLSPAMREQLRRVAVADS